MDIKSVNSPPAWSRRIAVDGGYDAPSSPLNHSASTALVDCGLEATSQGKKLVQRDKRPGPLVI